MINKEEFNENICGYKTHSNCIGTSIAITPEGDAIAYREELYLGGGETKYEYCRGWQEIKYTNSGRPYFFRHGKKDYVDTYYRIYSDTEK